jgi:hypothetical protein
MAKKLKPLIRRHRALEKVMARYRNLPFSWAHNRTCIHMLRMHLVAMGHKLEKVPKLDGPIAAKRELKKRGWKSVEAMLDDLLEPIPVAAMLPGDVSIVPGDDGLEAVYISLGSTAIGYAEDVPGMTLFTNPGAVFEKAWRV